MDIKRMLVTMGILSLFIYSMMSFIVITQTDGEVEDKITNNQIINQSYGDLETSLTNAESEGQSASNNFGEVTPSRPLGELEITSVVGVSRTTKKLTTGFYNILIRLPMSVLGVSPIVASLISALFLIFIVIGIWALWKGVISQ